MPSELDCLVLGYDDDTPRQFARLDGDRSGSVEYRSFLRNQVSIGAAPRTYMDALNDLVGAGPRWNQRTESPFYHVGEVTNLASLYLSSYLLFRGCSARPIGLVSAEENELIAALECERPRVVAMTTTFYEDTTSVERLVGLARQHCPSAVVVVGGPLVQNLFHDLPAVEFQAALERMGADAYVSEPEGEHTLLSLVTAVRDGGDLALVPNTFLPAGGEFRLTFAQREENRLDECAIEWPRFPDALLGKTVQTRTARSCAYHCSFCDYPIRAGKLSSASVDVVERELEALWRRGVENVVFVDDTFNVPEERFRAICTMMIRRKFGFRWFSYFRCGSVRRRDTFDLARASGCTGVFLGIESGDPGVLRNMDKASTVEQYLRGVEALHENGILTFASFIAGFPGETDASLRNTIAFLETAAPTLYRVEPWWYNHRAPIHRRAAELGLTGRAYDWRHATMSAQDACDGIDEIFASVRTSRWCPQQSFSFWALPYLMGKGMSTGELVEFHRLLHQLLPVSTTMSGYRALALAGGPVIGELTGFVQGLQLSAPRFVRQSARR